MALTCGTGCLTDQAYRLNSLMRWRGQVNIRMIDQGSSEMNIIVGVKTKTLKKYKSNL
ncbi:MAG: ACT domain-containing protein [Anaerovoracaceae bacterium]